ncbi:ferrochelatase 2 [Perilla frutescens var. hirtella]|nr:ferrochelatase 2 [Perilla frutescens var. hirtella]
MYSFLSSITREKFEEICDDLWEKALVPLKEVIKHSGLSTDDLYAVELIGGATRVPKLQIPCVMFSVALVGNEKIGVLLLNLGGPETLDDVHPFLFNLFADPPLAQFISIARSPKSKDGYASIGGGSPLRCIIDAQELRKALCDKNVPANVYVGMRYRHPFTEEAIE